MSVGSSPGEQMDGIAFRQALGEFATGVAVVTAEDAHGDPVAMTMSSFNSVSIDPPLVLFSVSRTSRSLPAMKRAKGFAVNVLARDQEALAERFAKRLEDRWAEVERTFGHMQAPLLTGALAHFECEPYARHDGGDHVVFIVRVIRHTVREDRPAPLLFFRGAWRSLRDEEG